MLIVDNAPAYVCVCALRHAFSFSAVRRCNQLLMGFWLVALWLLSKPCVELFSSIRSIYKFILPFQSPFDHHDRCCRCRLKKDVKLLLPSAAQSLTVLHTVRRAGRVKRIKRLYFLVGFFPRSRTLVPGMKQEKWITSSNPVLKVLSGHKQVQCVSVHIGLWSHSGQWYIVCHNLHSSVCVSVRVHVVVWHIN